MDILGKERGLKSERDQKRGIHRLSKMGDRLVTLVVGGSVGWWS